MALWPALFARSRRPGLQPRPSLTLFFCLTGAFVLTLVPHVVQLPLWITASVIVGLALRSFLELRRLPLPSTTFCGLLALCLAIGIFLQFQTVFGRDPGTAFMAGLLTIKFFELRSPRDIALIIFSSFFVVMSALLYSQVLELFIYCLIMMWVLTALLLRTHMGDAPEDQLLHMLSRSALVFCQALPFAIFLFFFFPRFQGKLQLTLDENPVGLTDRVEPGSISQLSNNDDEAMRVVLTGAAIPSTDSMYWRALVLWHYENSAWTPGSLASKAEIQPRAAPGSSLITQEITIWPHHKKWLFALEYAVQPAINATEPPLWSTVFSGDIVQLGAWNSRLDHKDRYTVISSATLADQVLTVAEKQAGTQIPASEIDPQVWSLADRLHRDNPNVESYIQSIIHYFRHEGFVYTTSPGVEGKNWLADFLFTSKSGFCEHFASSFAILMRLEGYPARVVVGYQGGEFNPYRNFYTIKQSNAHSWDEVWIESKKHWLRIDPVALLTAGEGGSFSAQNSNDSTAENSQSIRVIRHRVSFLSNDTIPDWLRRSIMEMQLRREQVEADWDDLVFSYNPETQTRLAQALGFGKETRSALLLACVLAAGICAIVFRQWMKRKQPVSPVENLYAQFCRNMAQRGIPRAMWEGPLAFTERAAEAFPEKREAIRDVGSIVARARYGPNPEDAAATKQLKTLLLLITASQAASSSREQS